MRKLGSQEAKEELKKMEPGTRIELLEMPGDPDPVAIGTRGTVEQYHRFSDSSVQIAVKWDNGRTLALVVPPDRYKVLTEEEEYVHFSVPLPSKILNDAWEEYAQRVAWAPQWQLIGRESSEFVVRPDDLSAEEEDLYDWLVVWEKDDEAPVKPDGLHIKTVIYFVEREFTKRKVTP